MRTIGFALAYAAMYVVMDAAILRAGILTSGDLLTVNSSNQLQSFTFSGTPGDILEINSLPVELSVTGVAQGVSVINGHLYIGLVSTNGSFTPKVFEVDSTTGAAISYFDTATPQITALGDDGTNLLLLDSVNVFNVYTYTPGGALVSNVAMTRPFAGNYQAEGIDGVGESIFMAYASGHQPIVTNATTGAAITYFDTNMDPIFNYIGGLAYDRNDGTLWVAGNGEFRHYTPSGTLLSTSFTLLGNAHVTGLEVIAPAQSVPEPSSIVTLVSLSICGIGAVILRRRRGKSLRKINGSPVPAAKL